MVCCDLHYRLKNDASSTTSEIGRSKKNQHQGIGQRRLVVFWKNTRAWYHWARRFGNNKLGVCSSYQAIEWNAEGKVQPVVSD